MNKNIDMSAQAVTNRMIALDELWELSVALRSSRIVKKVSARKITEAVASGESHDGTSELSKPISSTRDCPDSRS